MPSIDDLLAEAVGPERARDVAGLYRLASTLAQRLVEAEQAQQRIAELEQRETHREEAP